MVGSLLEQEFDDLVVELALSFVHFNFGAAEIVNEGISILLINDPINVSSMLNQHLCYQKANLLVLEACWLLNQPK